MKAEDSVINKMKSQSSQKTTDYLSAEHMFTSSPKEMSESPSEKTRQPLLRNVDTAKQDKVHTTTIETKEIQHNVSDVNERSSLKNNSVVDGLEINSGESNSQLGSLIEEKELDYNSTDKSNISNIDGNKLIHLSSIDVNKQVGHSSSRNVKTSKKIQKRNNKRSKLNETGQNRQTDAINIRKTTDMGLADNYLSSAETPDSLQNVEEENGAVQKSTDPSTHRTYNTLNSKKHNFQGKIKSKKTEKLTNKKRKKKKKIIKKNRIRNKSLNVTSKKEKKKFYDISTSTEVHRVSFATNKHGKKDEYRESSNKNETDRFTNWNRLPERVDQKHRFKLRNKSKENFQQDATFLPKFFFHDSRNLISTTKQISENKIKDRLSSVSPFRLFRYKNRKGKQHSLNDHNHFQKIVRNEGSLPDKTVKQSFPDPNPSTVTTIRNVLKPGKGKESAQQNISDNFEVSKLFRTTQSESTLRRISNRYDRRFKQNKQSYVTILPLTKIPKNVKELSETDVKQKDLNEKESRYTNNVKHKEVTEYTTDRTKWMLSDENLKLTSLPSKTSDLNDHLLNRDSSAPNFISTADPRHLSFENTIIKQTFKGSVTDLDANLKRNSSIQFDDSAPLNSDFIDEVQTTHENFFPKSSTGQVVISELSTNPTILSSGKGSSLRSLYGNTKAEMKKSKITRKQFTTPETELIYQTVNPKYLWQNTAQSKSNREQIAPQNDIHSNDPINLLSTQIPHDMLTKLPENVSLLQGLVPQSSTPKSENYKSEDNVAASSERSNEESKSSVTVNHIDDFTQTSISKVSDGISLRNEYKYNSYSINPTRGSYKHLSTSATPKELFHFPLDFDNSTHSKSIVDEKHRTSQISSTTTKDPKTSEHTILTTKYDTSVSTSELPTYSQDASVSTIMTNSQYKASSSHIAPTHQPLFQTTMIPTLRISPITRVVSTQNLSTKAAKIFRQTFPKLYSKIIVEQTSATTDKMPTSYQKSINNGNTSNYISSTLYLQPLSTRRTQLSSTQHPPYITKEISKRRTTPQTTNTSSQRTPSLATKSSTRNRPHLPTTLPKQHTSSITRKMILPPSTISTRNTKSHTIKLSSRTKLITTSKFSNPHILSRSFPKQFITTIVTSKTHKPNGSIQSEAIQKNAQYDFTSMTQTTKHISKDNRVPTSNTPSSNSVTPSPESVSTPLQETDSTSSQTLAKGHQNLLVVCKVDTAVNINSDQFQNNIRNGLVQSYIEGKALGEVNKSGSMKKRRKRSLEESTDQVHRINEMTLTKCIDGCKTGSDSVKAVIIRQDRRDTLVSIYFQMQENGSVVEAEKAAEIFARLQLTEISVHLKYAIFEKVTVIKSLLPRQGHPPKPSSTKWMMVTIAAPSIPVLCVIFILLSSWYRNHTRLRQKAMADISRGSGYTESLADVGLEIDMEKGEIVSRAGSTSVLWSEDFVASATKETNSHADYFGADYESSRSNSWSAYADPNNVFNSLRNKKRSPIPKRYQRQGKYAKKHSSSSFNFETGLEDECSPIYESFKPVLGRYKWPYTSTMQSNISCGRLAKEQQRQNDTSTSKACSEASGRSQMLRLSLHANIISQFLAELENM